MIKSGGWYDYNWNPVYGCLHGCPYCYAKRWVEERQLIEDFTRPQFFPETLDEPLKIKRPSVIFVCAFADLFGSWVPAEWIEKVLDIIRETPQHTYVFLTKNPKRYAEFVYTDNVYCGVTIEDKDRMFRAEELRGLNVKKFASIEPILGNFDGIDLSLFDWVVVGYQIYKKKTAQDKRNLKSVKHHNLHIIQR